MVYYQVTVYVKGENNISILICDINYPNTALNMIFSVTNSNCLGQY